MVETNQTSGLWPSLYEPFRNFGTRLANLVSPASDASTDDQSYRISMELPGVDRDDIELTVDEGVVTVTGEKKFEREDKGDTWYFSERQYGAFRRSFRLPGDADHEKVSADLKDGVLVVTVPKRAEPERSSRKIEVRTG
ncbi:Hsp20/alpha crystallin family protein [Ponticoccus sp. SC2-23]|uniref:Hsp20/alpha crystallin family protein n=1 Tax=Alexandriicola marinus TaxID=2081710 RepID=UPI000FD6E519|nr:Hsp20/alpha crystallin family protein [Alexandriicola marinus]MBM1221174.1 Hsp20/alpha crystallin family protein [Ponticoccus sp. SC6-9]MBM1225744.1 Hsp20/alpha crystallin family protein [Ponticoccus sp. SC6-15]MBM1227896.1 Hsp20/alpha crystallin family protein [Ponticoccus sp. SC6-38]MBM1234466.1 Hsp20/alpha crystallin family protein [Ponticoccus sp. SC6-45]MBM1238398.1 Hsp20/alpha crystallin family protein [Ponticoccus sp. SC6-49]MBM1243667.1 Hsp20/alpha crystallin family protein [Pontic